MDDSAELVEMQAALRAQAELITELRVRLGQLEAVQASTGAPLGASVARLEGAEPTATNRRGFLRLAGAAVAGVAVAAVAGAQPAAATNGDVITVGGNFTGVGTTTINNTTSVSLPLPASLPSGIKGVQVDNGNGVWGKADGAAGAGVFGDSTNGYGVLGASELGYALFAGGRGRIGSNAHVMAGPPPAGLALGDIVRDAAGDMFVCVQVGTPGQWRKIAGLGTAGSFHPIDPVRIFDSRSSAVLQPDVAVNVSVSSVIPSGVVARAATVNITITGTVNSGYLTAYPAGGAPPNASVINWSNSAQTIANGSTLKLGTGNAFTVVSKLNATHLLVDLLGYWS